MSQIFKNGFSRVIKKNGFPQVKKKNGFYKPFSNKSSLKITNFRRQSFESVFIPNGYVDIVSTKSINKKNIYGNKMYVFITKKIFEIDTIEDYILLKKI